MRTGDINGILFPFASEEEIEFNAIQMNVVGKRSYKSCLRLLA